jgi:carbamoyltransferase
MNILGLSVFCDSAAAIVADGRIVCAVEEERLNRVKHYDGMPWLAIGECLEIADMSLEDIDIIAISWNPLLGWKTRIAETVKSMFLVPHAFKGKLARGSGYIKGCGEILRLRRSLVGMFDGSEVRQKIVFVRHHLAHAASAFLVSAYEVADIMVADGVGERATISFFTGKGIRLSQIGQVDLPHSLGHLYASLTAFLGFRITHDEGKVMALAAFGEDTYRDLFSKLVRIDKARKTLHIDTRILDYHAARKGVYSSRWLELTGMHPRRPDEPLNQRHKDLACSLQKCLEEKTFSLLDMYFRDRGQMPLCAAGGLFLNSVLNGKIVRSYNDRFFVQPAAGDNGSSLGAALYVGSTRDRHYQKHTLVDVYLGRQFKDEEIREALHMHSLHPRMSNNIFSETADFIAQGKVIGWFRDRMEFGPRALGNRSILASPTVARMKEVLNSKVKHREEFRPFAGSVMLEEAHEYFECVQESPFMLKVFHFRDRHKKTFPAISHFDNSCRIQTVTQQQDLYRLLKEIKKRTGHGMVLNTSMNVAGEPIVNTPSEAIEVLRNSELDVLVLGDYIIRKEDVTNTSDSVYMVRSVPSHESHTATSDVWKTLGQTGWNGKEESDKNGGR